MTICSPLVLLITGTFIFSSAVLIYVRCKGGYLFLQTKSTQSKADDHTSPKNFVHQIFFYFAHVKHLLIQILPIVSIFYHTVYIYMIDII